MPWVRRPGRHCIENLLRSRAVIRFNEELARDTSSKQEFTERNLEAVGKAMKELGMY